MTQVLLSSREESLLLQLVWRELTSWPEQWSKLLEVLDQLERECEVIGARDALIRVELEGERIEEWRFANDAVGRESLRQRIVELKSVPFALEMQCSPLIILSDDRLEVMSADTPEPWELGEIPLSPIEENKYFSAPSIRSWRAHSGPPNAPSEPLLFLQGSFEIAEWANEIELTVRSRYDLWCKTRFDGEPNGRHAAMNAAVLVRCIRRLAESTEAVLEGPLLDRL